MKHFSVVSCNDIIDLIQNIVLQIIENNTLQTNQQLWLPQTFIDVHSLFTERGYIYIVMAIFDKTDIPQTGYV